jgi:hypothetical protein
MLADQIDSILKTNVGCSTGNGKLEYFANITSLKGAFLSCEATTYAKSNVLKDHLGSATP